MPYIKGIFLLLFLLQTLAHYDGKQVGLWKGKRMVWANQKLKLHMDWSYRKGNYQPQQQKKPHKPEEKENGQEKIPLKFKYHISAHPIIW